MPRTPDGAFSASSPAPTRMTPERRYDEHEIAEIFKQAVADAPSAPPNRTPGSGLTLAELETIGREVGIAPAAIARAAEALDHPVFAPSPKTLLGQPISVARTVDLPGSFSDEDWDLLVADLHETFQAHGEVRRDGSLRRWWVGNLQVLVEPTGAGHRLRIRTLSETQRALLSGGLLFFVMGLFFMLLVAAKGDFLVDMGKTIFTAMFSVAGLGSMGVAALRLPRWRKERAHQMEAVTARALERSRARRTPAPPPPALVHRTDLDLPPPEEPVEAPRPGMPRKTRS